LAGETEVLAPNPPQLHFVHHKSHLTRPGIEPGPPRWEAATNRLSYGAAKISLNVGVWNVNSELIRDKKDSLVLNFRTAVSSD
jgi:hypothetical protein